MNPITFGTIKKRYIWLELKFLMLINYTQHVLLFKIKI